MPTVGTAKSTGAVGGLGAAAVLGGLTSALGSDVGGAHHGRKQSNQFGNAIGSAVGGGALGSVVGGLAGSLGGDLLGGAFEDDKAEKKKFKKAQHGRGGSFTSESTETAYRPPSRGHEERFGQARVSHTEYPSGGHRDEYERYEQHGSGRDSHMGYGVQQATDVYPTYGGGFTQRTERTHEHPGGRWESEVQEQHVDARGQQFERREKKHGKKGNKSDSDSDNDSDDDSDDSGKSAKKERKRREKAEKMGGMQQRQEKHEKRRSGGPKSPRHERKHSR